MQLGSTADIASISGEIGTAEVLAIREARQRAIEARLDAERALREAMQTEAQLLAEEQDAIAAAVAARAERALEAARAAAHQERAALERVAGLESELYRSREDKAELEAMVRSVSASRDEARQVLERLTDSLKEFQERLGASQGTEHRLEFELAESIRACEELTRAREQAEAALPPSMISPINSGTAGVTTAGAPAASVPVMPALPQIEPASLVSLVIQPAAVAPVWAVNSTLNDPFAIAEQRAQRAEARRIADAERAQGR